MLLLYTGLETSFWQPMWGCVSGLGPKEHGQHTGDLLLLNSVWTASTPPLLLMFSQWAGRGRKSDGIWHSLDSKWPKPIFCIIQDHAQQRNCRRWRGALPKIATAWRLPGPQFADGRWVSDWLYIAFLFLFFTPSSFIRWSLSESMRFSCFCCSDSLPSPLAETEKATDWTMRDLNEKEQGKTLFH